ncbi:carbon-nitrogen hydrolase family protein [Tsukamurella soli]
MPDTVLRVAMLQGPTSTPGPASPTTVAGNLSAIAAAARRAGDAGADLLVTPEMSVTGYDIGAAAADLAQPVDGDYLDALATVAGETGTAIAYGYPERDGAAVYNTVTVVGPDGAILASYRKTHLFGAIDRDRFVSGDRLPVTFSLRGFPCGLLICYDVEFPEAVRAHADAGTELLLVPTGLMRPYDLIAEHIVPARAYESQLVIAYVNRCGTEDSLAYCGLSVAVAPDGEVLARAGRDEELLAFTASRAALSESRTVNTHLADRRTDLYPRGDAR